MSRRSWPIPPRLSWNCRSGPLLAGSGRTSRRDPMAAAMLVWRSSLSISAAAACDVGCSAGIGMSLRAKALCATVALWQLTSLALMILYRVTFAQLIVSAYSAWFGDIQASYGRFERLETYSWIIVITVPATLVSLLACDKLSHLRPSWRRHAIAFFGWLAALIAGLIWSYEVGFPYRINQLGWALLGPPEDLYSFTNLFLPRIIGWLICTLPISCLVLWLYGRSEDVRTNVRQL